MKKKISLLFAFVTLSMGAIMAQGTGGQGGPGGTPGHSAGSDEGVVNCIYNPSYSNATISDIANFTLVTSEGSVVIDTEIIGGVDPLDMYSGILSKGEYTAVYKSKDGAIVNSITFTVK